MFSAILLASALSVNGIFDIDTIPRKWYVGFDQGLSARHFPNQSCGFGVLIQPDGDYLVDETNSTRTYSNSYRNSSNEGSSEDKSNMKGARLLLEGFCSRKLNNYFTLTSFLDIGGGYRTYLSEYKQTSTDSYKDSYTDTTFSSAYVSKVEGSSKTFIASVGVMPGIKVGRFLFEFRLGLTGMYAKNETPEHRNNSTDGDSKNLRLIYPSDIVHALVIHLSI
jgi:hypothetical protein